MYDAEPHVSDNSIDLGTTLGLTLPMLHYIGFAVCISGLR